MNTLCESEVLQHKVCDSPETAHVEEGIKIKPVNVGEWRDVFRIFVSALTSGAQNWKRMAFELLSLLLIPPDLERTLIMSLRA